MRTDRCAANAVEAYKSSATHGAAALTAMTKEGAFFPDRGTSRIKNVTKRVFGYLNFWGAKIAVKRPSDRFKVGCPYSTDSELCGHTRHVNEFYHVISQLCPKIGPLISRCFSRSTNLGSRTHFCRVSQHSLEFDYPLSFKEHSTVL